MILQQAQKKRNLRREWWVFTVLTGLLLLVFLFIIFGLNETTNYQIPDRPGVIYCDAENVRDKLFVNGPHTFSYGNRQSDEQARSGQYSCKVPAGEGAQYGFGYTLRNPRPGATFIVTVWRYKDLRSEGRLVVAGEGQEPLYLEEGKARESEENNWEKLEIRFFVPYQQEITALNIYVYTNGQQAIYFDDLRIEMIEPSDGSGFIPEVIHLQLGEDAMNKLAQKREKAFKEGILEVGSEDWVEGELVLEDEEVIPIKLRLKGDWLDHLKGDKWSFRIKAKTPHTWKRMTTFSLHTPTARQYAHEWLLHQIWEKEDVLTTRYDFIELWLNGESLGIYAYEEHFEKQLVEYRNRREGPIIKLAEDGFWEGIKRQLNAHGYMRPGATYSVMDQENAPIEAFGEEEISADTTLKKQWQEAYQLLIGFKEQKLPGATVFDIDRMAKYYAICDILNAYHGITWHNQRFYYNPVNNKLEPVGFDGFGDAPAKQYSFLGEGALNQGAGFSDNLFQQLFVEEKFVEQYIAELYRMTEPSFFNKLEDDLWLELTQRIDFLQKEFPNYKLYWSELRANTQYLHSLILPFNNESLKVYTQSVKGTDKQLLLYNSHSLPIRIKGYGYTTNEVTYSMDSSWILPGKTPREFQRRLRKDSIIHSFNNIRFLEQKAINQQSPPDYYPLSVSRGTRYVFYQALGIDSTFYSSISPNAKPTITPSNSPGGSIPSKPFYTIQGKKILFHPGEFKVAENITIPEGYEVIFPAGTKLDFINGSGLLSYSAVQMAGTEESPVLITSSDKSGTGFTVIGASQRSVLKQVIFDNLTTLLRGNWQLTGAVNFYESDVNFYHCVFRNNHCEDALNTIRCTFEMDHCLVNNTFSDGFDSDFCKGTITNSFFQNTTNDGVDFSGSVINMKNCTMKNNGDKGVSIGEESDVTIFDSSIEGAPIGLASKDLSVLYAKNINLINCDQGFAAYQKKPEFGPASIIVEGYTAKNVKRLHAICERCSLQLNEKMIVE